MSEKNVAEKVEKAPKPKWEENMGSKVIQLLDRRPFDGKDPSKVKVVSGGTYLIEVAGIPFHAESNKREYLDVPAMVESIYQKGGIIEPIVVALSVADGVTVTLDQLLEFSPQIPRGNRRAAGAEFIRKNDPEYYAEYLAGRVPAMIVVNPTEEQLAAWRHDHGDQRALREEEVLAQGVECRRNGMDETDIIQLLWNGYAATRNSAGKGKIAELNLDHQRKLEEATKKFEAGDLSKAEFLVVKAQLRNELWRGRKAMARKFGQTVTRLAKMPKKVYDHYMLQAYPEACAERGLEYKLKLTGDDLIALAKVCDEAKGNLMQKHDAVLAAYDEIMLAKAPSDSGETTGEEGGESAIKKPMNRKKLLELADMMTSEIMRTILKGCAGEEEEREQFASIDGLLCQLESVRDERPEIWNALLSDPSKITVN